ncbi:helix-turn-helix domain-containing protein [Ancylobacter sonchi]|uniref:helix-turn-helix domain-containing protein n=1 Tax=Ancylobacter sonchi TaxID=1937790 RepID=UPI001BD3E232|nr:helix-turn-helix domain-containing protein [Ancylobacter sonchi]MBS7534798.1 helix-turn-helix domain-containing protein [Ancylobacter sonchi]
MKFLDIGEVCAATGIKPSALRYYEEIGLVASISRHGLRRQFEPDVLLQLKLIAMGRIAGFSLAEIGGMFGRDQTPALSRPAILQKAADIDRQIRELTALRDTLRHVAACPAPSHLECPTFRRLLDVVAKQGRSRARKPRRPAKAALP